MISENFLAFYRRFLYAKQRFFTLHYVIRRYNSKF